MEPFYFGTAPNRLFGAYHPASRSAGRTGAVLCYPAGQEYMRCHRIFLKLAQLLAARGVPVLRFDFSGCGDSEGDHHQHGLEQWVRDILTAADELQGGSDVKRICLIGLRLGATLALKASGMRSGLDQLVLWSPVVSGADYLAELHQQHAAWLAGSFATCRRTPGETGCEQALGFPMSSTLIHELEVMDALKWPPPRRVCLVDSTRQVRSQRLREHLTASGAEVSHHHIPAEGIWTKQSGTNHGLVSMKILETIVNWTTAAS